VNHKIATSVPINRTAARVVQRGPKGYESGKRILTDCSPVPLPTKPVPRKPQLLDLTGRVVGHLTVVGAGVKRSSNGMLWVCRCVCGYYTTRRTGSLLNPANDADRCDRCREVAYLKRKASSVSI
jgi:hypothetical protein